MKWQRIDVYFLLILVVLAIFIWLRDITWMTAPDDTLPVLAAIPVFFWLGMPWSFQPEVRSISIKKISLFAFIFLLGIVVNLTVILAIAWTMLLWIWLSSRIASEAQRNLIKLLVLPLMAFPWVSLDLQWIGWWFRLSGAWVTAQFFLLLNYPVFQEGTNILINGIPIAVEVACAGLNTLQSMFIAGSAMAYIMLGNTNLYWRNLPLLVGLAWLSNVIRIIFLVIIALVFSPQVAEGSIHMWGGWFILCLMFAFCWLLFKLQEPQSSSMPGGKR